MHLHTTNITTARLLIGSICIDLGGIEYILGLYAYHTSREAGENLFCVVFDYAVSEVGDKKQSPLSRTLQFLSNPCDRRHN